MERIAVVGAPGSGKTTVAAALAGRLELPHVELDSIFHQAGWVPLPDDEFRERVAGAAAGRGWVIDGNYSVVQDIVWAAADTVVALDLPRAQIMRRLLVRSLRRIATRERLWNGNRERLVSLFRWDPEKNLLRWAWLRHPLYREKWTQAMSDSRYAQLRFVRLSTTSEVEEWLATVPSGS